MHFTTTLSLFLVALASTSTITLASPQPEGSYPGKNPDGLIWKRYEPRVLSTGHPPPPPHPAQLAPRSIHRSKPSRYHTAVVTTRHHDRPEEGGGGKRTLMRAKQVSAQEVRKRALEKKDQRGGGGVSNGKKVYFDVKRKLEREQEGGGEGDEEDLDQGTVEGWSWLDDEEILNVKNDESLSWAQKMERRMRKTRPLFTSSN
ncbi:hypothetical protein JCM5350_007693 [Sporobolomyces pararoseus]